MSQKDQFVSLLNSMGVVYEDEPGGTGSVVTTHDTTGTGKAHWKFDTSGTFEHVSHSSS